MSLTPNVYNATNAFPKSEIFALSLQIRRCSISIPSNIAEGYGRDSNKEYLRFLNISVSSLFELQTQLEIAKNISYLAEKEFNNLNDDSRELERTLVSFTNKIKQRN